MAAKNPTKSFFLKKSESEPEIGFTTGTCAAAGSVAAVRMLLAGEIVQYVILTVPKGIKVCIEIENQAISENEASCSVQKFSGSDPDVTNGIKIFSTVRKIPKSNQNSRLSVQNSYLSDKNSCRFDSETCHFERVEKSFPNILIKGGEGVGRVTLPGLDQKIGEAAINSVPQKMILDGVRREIERLGKSSENFSLEIEISVPGGEEIAKKTFNPKLGIVGGISILGTSGIVEPMSEQALLETIKVEINVRKSQGFRILPIVPGNYGADFLKSEFDFSAETAVHCSNFVYDSLQMAVAAPFSKILFCGHIGKLVKIARGLKNTHSKYGDYRMEVILEVVKQFFDEGSISENQFLLAKKGLESAISTEQAVKILDSLDDDHKIREKTMYEILRRIKNVMTDWTCKKLEIEIIIFTKENGLLAMTENAGNFLKNLKS